MRFLLLCIMGALLAGCGGRQPPPPGVLLTVRSEPAGAEVLLDDRPVGRTPFRARVSPGGHRVGVAAAGFETAWERVPAEATAEHLLDVRLRPVTAAVLFESEPAGAALTLNGETKGVTPLLLPQLPVGRYEAQLAGAGMAARKFTFTLEDGRPRRIRERLDSILGTLVVWSDQPGADVTLNGKAVGLTPDDGQTPLVIADIPAGEYVLGVRKAGYREITQPLVVQAQQRREVRVSALQAEPGGLEITSEPGDAEVYSSEGALLGRTPYRAADLAPGKVTVRLKKTGYAEEVRSVVVAPGAVQRLTVTLSRFFGGVSFTSEPPGCRVRIDGQAVGHTEPAANPRISKVYEYGELAPGAHLLELQHPEYETLTARFAVEQGKLASMGHLRLKKRWIPTHRLRLVNGNEYEGVLVRRNDDGSVLFEISPTTKAEYKRREIEAVTPLKAPAPPAPATGGGS